MAFLLARVDIDTADDVLAVKDGVGESAPFLEVSGMADEVGKVALEAHRFRPRLCLESRGRPDMVDAGHPGFVVSLVVLRSKWFQAEAGAFERSRHVEIGLDKM